MDDGRAGRIELLLKHPSWPDLEAQVADFENAYLAYLAGRIFAGEIPDDLEYKRGFVAGMKSLLKYPTIAEKTLERTMRKNAEEDDAVA